MFHIHKSFLSSNLLYKEMTSNQTITVKPEPYELKDGVKMWDIKSEIYTFTGDLDV